MRKCLLIFLLIALFLPTTDANAQDQDESETIEELYLEGRARYKARDFKGAIESFKSAYKLERNPNFAYNIAKIYEKLKDWDNAITYYNEFLVLPDIKEKDRKFALEKTKELEELKELDAQRKAKAEEKERDPVVKPAPEVDHTTSYVLLGTGGALLVTGAVFGVLANGQQSAFDDATTSQQKIDARDTGKSYALIADVGMGLGVVTAGVGLVLYFMGSSEAPPVESKGASSNEAQSQVVPWVSTQGGGMSWTLRF